MSCVCKLFFPISIDVISVNFIVHIGDVSYKDSFTVSWNNTLTTNTKLIAAPLVIKLLV